MKLKKFCVKTKLMIRYINTLRIKFISSKELYLVKWKHYSIHESTWEPIENLDGSKALLEEYENNKDKISLPIPKVK